MIYLRRPNGPISTLPVARTGRGLLGALFLISGSLKIAKYAAVASVLAAKGVPLSDAAAALVIVIEMAGGLALIAGWRAREAALALALFVIPATFIFHAFWSVDAAAYQNQLNHFLKNMAIFGALLVVASRDWRGETARDTR